MEKLHVSTRNDDELTFLQTYAINYILLCKVNHVGHLLENIFNDRREIVVIGMCWINVLSQYIFKKNVKIMFQFIQD